GAEHEGTGAIAEQDGDVAAARGEVERVAVELGADQEDAAVGAGADERVGHLQAVDEGRALLADIEARAAGALGDAELGLEDDASAGEVETGRQRAEDDAS